QYLASLSAKTYFRNVLCRSVGEQTACNSQGGEEAKSYTLFRRSSRPLSCRCHARFQALCFGCIEALYRETRISSSCRDHSGSLQRSSREGSGVCRSLPDNARGRVYRR